MTLYREVYGESKPCIYKEGKNEMQTKYNIQQKIIDNHMYLIIGTTGSGKSVHTNVLASEFKEHDYTVVYVTEKKGDELANAFHIYNPEKEYHKGMLKEQNQDVKTIPAKIYHPFTINMPYRKKLPPINFFTYSLKDITRNSLNSIISSDSQVIIEVAVQIINKLEDDSTLYDFLWEIYKKIKGQEEKETYDADSLIPSQMAGDKRTIDNINLAFKPFLEHYMIMPENDPLKTNLDFVKMLNDNEHIHHLTLKYINDEKVRVFAIIQFLENIMKTLNSGKVRKQVLLVFEEMKILLPSRNLTNFEEELLELVKKILSTIRTKASVISTSQSLADINSDFQTLFDRIFFGMLNFRDIKSLIKDYQFRKEDQTKLYELKVGEFVEWGSVEGYDDEKTGSKFGVDVPPFANAEQGENFFTKYLEHPEYSKQAKDNYEIWRKIKSHIKDVRKRRTEQIKEWSVLQNKEKEIKKDKKEGKLEEAKVKIKEVQDEKKDILMKGIYDLVDKHSVWNEDKQDVDFERGWSWREIGRRLPVSHVTAQKYYLKYKEQIEREEKRNNLPNLDKPNPNNMNLPGKYG